MSRLLRHFRVLVRALAIGFVVAVAVACSGAGEPPVPGESAPEASLTQATTVAPTPTETPEPTPLLTPTQPELAAAQAPTPATDYDSTENMFRFFSGQGYNPGDTLDAITLAIANDDKSMVPVMIEMLRFFWDEDLLIETTAAISLITGQEFSSVAGDWNGWMEWLGKNADEYRPPDGYVRWKSALMILIDPRLGEFLAPAAQGSRINVFEIAWGGVRPDGIPDLQNAPVVSAGEQDYLQPSDRVFGVSINGEHRAYPLRIVNAHEMANDVLGGEPIALAY